MRDPGGGSSGEEGRGPVPRGGWVGEPAIGPQKQTLGAEAGDGVLPISEGVLLVPGPDRGLGLGLRSLPLALCDLMGTVCLLVLVRGGYSIVAASTVWSREFRYLRVRYIPYL